MANKELRQLAMDVYQKREVKFGEATGSDAINNALLTAVGGEWNRKNFRKNKYDVFEVIEDLLTLPLGKEVVNVLNGCVEVEDWALGDKKEWRIPSRDKFRVAKIAAGHKDIRRQSIGQDKKVTIDTEWFGVKIYEEFEQLVSGRVSFADLVLRVRESFEKHVTETVTKVVFDSYTSLTSGNFYVEGAVDTSNLSSLIARVETKTGMKCAVYGTKAALAKIAEKQLVHASEEQKRAYGAMGYIGTFEGTDLIELPIVLDDNDEVVGKDAENMLFVLPIGLKTIKVVFEGDAVVDETTEVEGRNDLQAEYVFMRKMGVGVVISNYHGVYKITA